MAKRGYRIGDLTKGFLKRKVRDEMRKVVDNDPRVQVHGPVRHSALHAPVLAGIQDFRAAQYARIANYLNSPAQAEIETRGDFDRRSFHFYATYEEDLVGSVRVTPHPFELGELTPDLREASRAFANFLELGRLLVADGRQRLGIGKKMLYASMLWAAAREYSGFVAICREHRRPEFERFGMRAFNDHAFTIPERQSGHYFFLSATWCQIQWGTATHYAVERVKKKLRKKREPHERINATPTSRRTRQSHLVGDPG